MRVFRINAVNTDRRVVVLGTVDTATEAASKLRDALNDYPRAWVSDEYDEDVGLAELIELAEKERQPGSNQRK